MWVGRCRWRVMTPPNIRHCHQQRYVLLQADRYKATLIVRVKNPVPPPLVPAQRAPNAACSPLIYDVDRSEFQHTERFLKENVTSNSFVRSGPLYWDMQRIKITIPACPAAQLKLLGCYMLLCAISFHGARCEAR